MEILTCPSCQHQNPIEARFCQNCGTPIQQIAIPRIDPQQIMLVRTASAFMASTILALIVSFWMGMDAIASVIIVILTVFTLIGFLLVRRTIMYIWRKYIRKENTYTFWSVV